MTSATPSQANIATQCSRTASSSASKAMPAPSAVNTCTENAAARFPGVASEVLGWFTWSMAGAVLSGFRFVCTCGVAAIGRAKEHAPDGLKTLRGMSIVRGMQDVSVPYDVAVVGGGPAGLSAAIALAEPGARVVLIARRLVY